MPRSAESDDQTTNSIQALILSGAPYGDEGRPFLTLGDIAGEIGVSKQTVRRRISEIAAHPAIESSSVGQADVYWRAGASRQAWNEGLAGEGDSQQALRDYFEHRKNVLISARARWLQAKQEALADGADEASPEARWELWRLIGAYLDSLDELGHVSFGVAAAKQSLPSEYVELLELDDYEESAAALPADFRTEGFRRRLYETVLFDAPFGSEVKGLAMLLPHYVWVSEQLSDEGDSDEIDEVVPSMRDMLYAGDVLDQFVAQLYGYYW